jgi:hypothetical protein
MLTVALFALDIPSMPEGVSVEAIIEALGVFSKVYIAINAATIVLAALQVLTMVFTFVFNLRSLGEYIGYYFVALLSLACTAGSWFYSLTVLSKILENF